MGDRRSGSHVVGYLLAVAVTAAAAGLTQITWPFFELAPISLFFVAMMAAAWYGGLGPGLLATFLGLFVCDYVFVQPYFAFWPPGRADVTYLVSLGIVGSFVSVLSESMHRARRRAERTLSQVQEREEQFRSMADSIPQLAWMANPDGFIFWYNQRWHEYTGTTLAETEGWDWQSVHDPDVLPRVMAGWGQAIATAQPFQMEFPLRGAGGEFRTFLTRVQPLKDAQDRLVRWFGTSTDVEELKRAEKLLRASESRLSGIIDSAMDAIITIDAEQRIQVFNRAAETMFLCPAVDAIGQSIERFIPARFRPTHADHIRSFGGTGVTTRSMAGARSVFGRRSDGTEFPIEASISQIESGGQKLFTVIMRDVTERHRAEDRFRQVIEHAPNGMVMVDDRGRIEMVNAQIESSFGYSRAELIGQPIEVLVPERFRSMHPEHRDGFIAHPTTRSMGSGRDLFGLRQDGSEFPVEIGLNPIETAAGMMVLGTIVDITERKSAEEQLKASEAKLGGIIESARDAIITVDRKQHIQVFNQAAEKMFLCPVADALGQPLDRFIPERFRGTHSSHIHDFAATGVTTRAMAGSRAIYGLRTDGTEFPLEASISQVEAGGEKFFTVIMRDVTERHRAEDRFRQVIEHAPSGMVMVDDRGRITLVNAQIEKSFGYEREELIGEPIEVLVPERFRSRHPEYRNAFLTHPTTRSMGTGRDLFGRRKDGSEFPVEIGLNPVETASGVMVLGTIVDITERKRAEDERRTSEERYRTLFDYAPDGIVIADPNSYYLDANASICEMLGYSREEFVGMHASDIVAPEEVSHIGQALGVIKSEAEYQREWQFRRRDGSTFPAEVIATLMPDGNLLGVIRDITDRKHAEESLRASETKLSGIIQSAMDAIITVDSSQRVMVFNRAAEKMFLSPAADAIGQPLDQFIPQRFRDNHASHIESFGHTGVSTRAMAGAREVFGLRSDGTEFPIEASISQIESEGQKIFTVILRDVTERHRAEGRFQQVIEHAPNGMVMVDDRGRITLANTQIEKSFGYAREELIGQPIEILVPERFRSGHPAYRDGFIAHPTTRSMGSGRDLFGLRKDGSEFPVEIGLNPIETDTGMMILGTVVDITERKRNEEALRESEARLRIVTENARVGLVMVNAERRYTFANSAYAEILGLPSADIVGQRIADVLPHLYDEQVRPRLDLAFAGERVTYELNRPDHGVERYYAVSYEPMVAANAEAMVVVVVITEITDRKQAVIALQESKAELETIVENLDEGIAVSTLDGQLIHFNRAALEMHGFTDLAECRRHLTEFTSIFQLATLAGDVIPVDEWPLARILRGERLNNVEIEIHSLRNGRRLIFAYGGTLVHDETGRPLLAVVTIRDITEAKSAEQEIVRLNTGLERRVRERTAELQAVNKELEAFSYSVSHDLRAPLRHINGFSLALLEDYGDQLDAEGKGFLQEVRGASQEMSQLIDHVLQLARVTRAEMIREEVDLTALAEKTVATLRERDPGREVSVTIEPGLAARGDKRLLEITLVNLLGNAWKFTSKTDHAQIKLISELIDGERVFCVQDNGAGFDQTFSDKLFRAFQRLHTGAEFEGTGIGLATVQRVINRHGGRVWAQGKVGGGASFFFTLTEP